MAKIKWDQTGERFYEAGVDHAVLGVYDETSSWFGNLVAWNGITAVNEAPEGAEPTSMYADDIKYVNIISAEDFKFTIEAFTYPSEFNKCDGRKQLAPGVFASQQSRSLFCLAYRTKIGNDISETAGYKLHLIYNAKAGTSSVDRGTINESTEGVNFSWECSTTPIEIQGADKPAAHIIYDSRYTSPAVMAALELMLFGDEDAEPKMPTPSELATINSTPTQTTETTDDTDL